MTLALSIIATVLGIINLSWNVFTWRMNGPHVKVKVVNAFPTYGGEVGDHFLGIQANNKGRSPVTINNVYFEMPTGENLFATSLPNFSAKLPHRLEAGSSATWYILADQVREICAQRGWAFDQLQAWVDLGNGSKVSAMCGVPLG